MKPVGSLGKVAVSPRDLAGAEPLLSGQLDAAEIHAKQLEAGAALLVKDAGGAALWKKANQHYNPQPALLALIDQVAPESAADLKAAWDEQRRLAAVVKSFESLCGLLDIANRRGEEHVLPSVVPIQATIRKRMLSGVETVSKALRSAGVCDAASKFPLAQLSLLRENLREQLQALLANEQPIVPILSASDASQPKLAIKTLGRILGDDALATALGEAGKGKAWESLVGAFTMMVDQASSAPDYSMTRSGGHYPDNRVGYRMRLQDPEVMYWSESRLDASHGAALKAVKEAVGAKEPSKSLEKSLVTRFLNEIGAPPQLAADWKPSIKGIGEALANELLLPLRALNELVQDMAKGGFHGAHGHYAEFRQVVTDITKAVVEGNYREWRNSHPASLQQLSVLDAKQKDAWTGHNVTLEAKASHGGTLKTREEDGLGLFWVTKIGGPSHGFDYGPHCLLPLLANARSRAIVVDDSKYPHHPSARSYLRLLSTPEGKPILFLEPLQIDFIHGRTFDQPNLRYDFQKVILEHAWAKAKELGVPLSVQSGLGPLVDELGVETKLDRAPKYVLAASGGVLEASDSLSSKHDWVQLKDELLDLSKLGDEYNKRLIILSEGK